MKKRLLSAILLLSMLIGMCPVRAMAASETATGELLLTMRRSDDKRVDEAKRVAGTWAETDFTVKLTNAGGYKQEKNLHAEQGAEVSSLGLTGIADGSYTLTVTAPNYLTYEQTLEFDGRCVQLDLYSYAHINAELNDQLHGVMPVGDMNADGKIDDADADLITAAIGTTNPSELKKYDLSGDGRVDLTDLALAVRNQSGVVLATPVHTVSSTVLTQALNASAADGTEATGSELSELLDQSKEGTKVKLTPASGETISGDSPVELELSLTTGDEAVPQLSAEALVIAPPAGSKSTIAAGTVTVEAVKVETGEEITIRANIGSDDVSDPPQGPDAPQTAAMTAARGLAVTSDTPVPMADASDSVTPANGVSVESDGTVVIDLGQQVAIKKVTIRVTASADRENPNLVEIAKVQFLSDFAERIPEPQMSVPTVRSVSNTESDGLGYKDLTVTWDPQPNVTTGYEVKVSGPGYNKTATTNQTSYTFQGDSFNGTVKSFEKYTITVRSVSGDWKSNWSEPYIYTVTCTSVPPAPEYVTVTPGVCSLTVTWTCKYDAEDFILYYKGSGDAGFTAVEGLTAPRCTLENLQAGVRYTLYVEAHNRNGTSPKSAYAEGTPVTATGVQMPKYKLINVDAADGFATTHIASIQGNTNTTYTIHRADGTTVDCPATAEDWKVLLDNDPNSYLYIPNWDNAVHYNNFRGPMIQLDRPYEMDTFRLSPFEGIDAHIAKVSIRYKTAEGTYETIGMDDVSFYNNRRDSQDRRYYEIVLPQPITTDYVEIHTTTNASRDYQTICEVKLYYYDSLENDTAALFADDMRTALKDTVTMDEVTALIERANTADEVSGEDHPHKATILTDLEYARKLLESTADAHILTVDNQITASGSPNGGFAQALSDYQPLGVVAAAGDTVVIYVSGGGEKRGDNVRLNLIAAQYHPQVSAWQSNAIQLKAGRNEITIPKTGSDASERGGSLYLQYVGNIGVRNYTVRVTGGTYIPVLNVDGVAGAERTAAIEAYVNELRDYAAGVEALHGRLHGADKENTNVRYDYAADSCFLNSTELCMENMMYSLPATEVWKAINAGGDPVRELETSLAAMEQMIDYFYQFKGLHRDAEGADAYPYTRLNIRYHKMFTGAFMYAASKHIGIEFGSTGAVFGLNPITADENGKYQSGNLTGWGIAHEIGHCINHPSYQRVEVTNNMFAQLAKTGGGSEESSSNFRTTYDKVYRAVAAGNTGHTGDLAVQLAMYWQLHLAYDDNYAYKLYDSAEAAQEAVFYARLESYLRDGAKAPEPFTASGGDQLFMQAACAAANKNILSFFEAWGFTPDAATRAYAAQYSTETRKIQYIDDDSRLYRLEGGVNVAGSTTVTASITNTNENDSSRINGNKVTISLSNDSTDPDAMLGYEICRNGKMVAFVPAGETSYTDIVTTENNKAFTYTVTGIDKLLNETETVTLDEVKVCHDGSIDKKGWTAQTNMTSARDTVAEKDANDPESGMVSGNTIPGQEKISAITAALDNDENTVYYGTAGTGSNRPYILLDLGGVEQVTAIKFTPARTDYSGDASEGTDVTAGDLYKYRLFGYKVEISLDGSTWTTVKEGNAYKAGSSANPSSWVKADDIIYSGSYQGDGSYTLYFNRQLDDGSMDPYMYTYDAAYVRITSTTMSAMALAEIDVLGPTNDNVELVREGFGRLSADYRYGSGQDDFIPADSIVFYGEYKGDPSYNVVLLKDQSGKVLDGSQIILARVAESGALGGTSDGRWLFWLEDEDKIDKEGAHYNEMDQMNGLKSVQVELYRVQDAFTLAGQRLTSTSLTMDIPSEIPPLVITSSAGLTAYAPGADAAAAAAAGVRDAAVTGAHDLYLGALALGDTGAAEGDTVSPIKLTSNGATITAQFRPANSTKVAVQAELVLSPATAVAVLPTTNRAEDVYESYKYDSATGKLLLIAVARQNGLGEDTLSARLTPENNCKVTVTGLIGLSNLFEMIPTEEKDLPEISIEFSKPSAPGGGSTGSGGGSSGAGTAADPETDRDKGTTTATVNAGATVSGTTASAAVSKSDMDQAVESAVAGAAQEGTVPVVKVVVGISAQADSLNVTLPVSSLRTLAEADGPSLIIISDIAEVALDRTALSGLVSQAAGSTIILKVAPVAESALNDAQKEALGETAVTVVDLSMVSNDVVIHDYNNGVITVSLPYTLSDGQTARDVTVYYLDDDGSLEACATSYADGKVTFTARHLSRYVIGGAGLASAVTAFTDIAADAYYADAVAWAVENGITLGTTSTTFSPEEPCTRAQIVTFLYRAYGSRETTYSTTFTDVAADAFYADAVAWAAVNGITLGTDDSHFSPDKSCTRAEAVTFLYRAEGTPDASGGTFSDVDSGAYYADAVAWAVANGVTTGTGDNNFSPDATCTRAQIVTFLYRNLVR